jgi:ketosteroid isomerase-like protein
MATKGSNFDAKLTPQTIQETIGTVKATAESARVSSLSAEQIASAEAGIQQLLVDCTEMSAAYNEAAKTTGADARLAMDQAKVSKDRATLESMFADEYTFVDPFGVVGNKQSTIENIMSGKIRREGFGKAGFETTESKLQVYGNTAVSTGTFSMQGSVSVRYVDSGAVRRRDISGVYHTTHTYIYRDGRWQLASSHMTKDATDVSATTTKRYTHGPPEEPNVPGF